ncbi:MAG: hypothetical protein SCARUB_00163 [Candidatus Scalindua rubra]|uniref:Glycosyltransferase RgtA/B/C/D-like domain-containing protein n=1 Tax=Candidatus Scalindua rubra TaxID=1872076 RepID=A0A1E3XGH3_9BACT|nr:MAG: hypothetical protein SCARUB_00163 [Candidatus Scalindua rubra]
MTGVPKYNKMANAPPSTQPRKLAYYLIPFFLALAFNLHLYFWLKMDETPLVWDQTHYYKKAVKNSLYFHDAGRLLLNNAKIMERLDPVQKANSSIAWVITAPFRGALGFCQAIYSDHKRPFLVPVVMGLLLPVFGGGPDGAVLSLTVVFSTVLIFSLWILGRKLYGELAGFLAAFLGASYPIIIGHSQVPMLDVPLTACVALIYTLFIASNRFLDRRASVYFGLALGFGMLTKENFFIFAIPIAIVAGIDYLFRRLTVFKAKMGEKELRNSRQQLTGAMIGLFLATLICGVWYFQNVLHMVKGITLQKAHGTMGSYVPFTTYEGATYYLHSLINEQVSFPFVALFLLAIAVLCVKNFRRKCRKEYEEPAIPRWTTVTFVLWLVFPLLFFLLWPSQSHRFTMPILGAVAVITGVGIASIRRRWVSILITIAVVGFGIVQSVQIQWPVQIFRSIEFKYGNPDINGVHGTVNILNSNPRNCLRASSNPYPYEEIAALFRNAGKAKLGDKKYVELLCAITPDVHAIVSPSFYILARESKEADILKRGIQYDDEMLRAEDGLLEIADLVIFKEGGDPGIPFFVKDCLWVRQRFEEIKSQFELMRRFDFGDKGVLYVYKRSVQSFYLLKI